MSLGNLLTLDKLSTYFQKNFKFFFEYTSTSSIYFRLSILNNLMNLAVYSLILSRSLLPAMYKRPWEANFAHLYLMKKTAKWPENFFENAKYHPQQHIKISRTSVVEHIILTNNLKWEPHRTWNCPIFLIWYIFIC